MRSKINISDRVPVDEYVLVFAHAPQSPNHREMGRPTHIQSPDLLDRSGSDAYPCRRLKDFDEQVLSARSRQNLRVANPHDD
jgi:hypothetical protein